MRSFVLALVVLLGCSSARYQKIKMVNRSPHTIESIFVYAVGSANRGPSRGSLAPSGAVEIAVKEGNVEVLAVTAKESIGDGQRERKEATQVLELRAPVELVFHNSDQKVADRPGTIGVQFRVLPSAEKPADDSPAEPPPVLSD